MSIASDQQNQKHPEYHQKLVLRPIELLLLILFFITLFFSLYLYNQISIIQDNQNFQNKLMQKENKRMLSKYRQKINRLIFKIQKLEDKIKEQSNLFNLTTLQGMIKNGVSLAFLSAFSATQTFSQISKSGKQFAQDLYQKVPSSDELSKLGEQFMKSISQSETKKMVGESLSNLWSKVKNPFK